MPARKKKPQRGKGIADVARYIRDNKLISQGLGLIPHPGAQAVSQLAALAGLGKKKKRKPAMRGRGIFSDLGGGLGSLAGGIGGGLGSLAHGLFGGRKKTVRRVVKYT